MKRALVVYSVIGYLFLCAGFVAATDQERTKENIRSIEHEYIYGSQLMTAQEREQYRTKMRAAKTPEERERIRVEHHERMQERARERGITPPDEPPGMGQGGGMGPGGGGGRRR